MPQEKVSSRLPAFLVSTFLLVFPFASGCSHPNGCSQRNPGEGCGVAIVGSGGSGGSGGTSGGTGGTSGGTGGTSGGTGGTSGGTSGGTGGSGGGSGGSGGSGGGSGGSGSDKVFTPGPATAALDSTPAIPVQGLVNGGQSRAVAGSRVYLLEASTAGSGSRSVSLLTSATGNPADFIGHYAISGEYGGFAIAGSYTCTPGREVYLLACGGNSGNDGPNSAIGLMAALGICPRSGTFANSAPFIVVNEVTTVAAAYAMAGKAPDPIHLSASAPSTSLGLADAAGLANVVTGFARTENQAQRRKIHTLANILFACVNSDGPASRGCVALFSNARTRGAAGEIPADTATAAINIARNPGENVAALYGLQPRIAPPFQPSLESAPPDFTLPLATHEPGSSVALLSRRQ